MTKLDRADKIQLGISYFLQSILLIAIIISFYKQNWITAFLTLAILIFTFLPAILKKNYKVYLPVEIELITVIFIFAALFLGEIHQYYLKIWWWDVILHTTSGILFGILGFILVYVLNQQRKISITMKAGFVALFSFAFAVTIGATWEIFEFGMDTFFSLNMQKSGLTDTMWDIIVNHLGALLISIIGYYYVKKKHKALIFDRIIKRFVKGNPKLFRKRK